MALQDRPPRATVVIELAGKLTIGPDAKMRDAIAEAAEAGARNILLDMQRVTKLDSSGIGELAAAHMSMKKRDGRLLLIGLSDRLAAPLQIVNLLGVLELYETIDEALATLDSPRD